MPGLRMGLGLDLPPRFCVCSGLETVEPRRKGEGQKEEREGDGLIDEWRATLCLPELWLVRRVSNLYTVSPTIALISSSTAVTAMPWQSPDGPAEGKW